MTIGERTAALEMKALAADGEMVRLTPLKNGGDHSFGSRFGPLRNRPPVFWCHFLESWLQDGENREKTRKNGAKMGEIRPKKKSAGRRSIIEGTVPVARLRHGRERVDLLREAALAAVAAAAARAEQRLCQRQPGEDTLGVVAVALERPDGALKRQTLGRPRPGREDTQQDRLVAAKRGDGKRGGVTPVVAAGVLEVRVRDGDGRHRHLCPEARGVPVDNDIAGILRRMQPRYQR